MLYRTVDGAVCAAWQIPGAHIAYYTDSYMVTKNLTLYIGKLKQLMWIMQLLVLRSISCILVAAFAHVLT